MMIPLEARDRAEEGKTRRHGGRRQLPPYKERNRGGRSVRRTVVDAQEMHLAAGAAAVARGVIPTAEAGKAARVGQQDEAARARAAIANRAIAARRRNGFLDRAGNAMKDRPVDEILSCAENSHVTIVPSS
ncbi:MAG: hypothetical protein JSR61_00795 [Proteobacteria bacterium]|nr:hypothetical protein [Pseudomonadota bacterium]